MGRPEQANAVTASLLNSAVTGEYLLHLPTFGISVRSILGETGEGVFLGGAPNFASSLGEGETRWVSPESYCLEIGAPRGMDNL